MEWQTVLKILLIGVRSLEASHMGDAAPGVCGEYMQLNHESSISTITKHSA